MPSTMNHQWKTLAPQHSRKVLRLTFEHTPDGRRIAGENHRDLQAVFQGDNAEMGLDVVRDPVARWRTSAP